MLDLLLGLIGVLTTLCGGLFVANRSKGKQVNALKVEKTKLENERNHFKSVTVLQSKIMQKKQEVIHETEEDLRAPDKYSRT